MGVEALNRGGGAISFTKLETVYTISGRNDDEFARCSAHNRIIELAARRYAANSNGIC